jgi:hypothetical protein
VEKIARNLLIDLNMNLSGALLQKKFAVWESFVNRQIAKIRDETSIANEEHVCRILSILLAFLDRYEGIGENV